MQNVSIKWIRKLDWFDRLWQIKLLEDQLRKLNSSHAQNANVDQHYLCETCRSDAQKAQLQHEQIGTLAASAEAGPVAASDAAATNGYQEKCHAILCAQASLFACSCQPWSCMPNNHNPAVTHDRTRNRRLPHNLARSLAGRRCEGA